MTITNRYKMIRSNTKRPSFSTSNCVCLIAALNTCIFIVWIVTIYASFLNLSTHTQQERTLTLSSSSSSFTGYNTYSVADGQQHADSNILDITFDDNNDDKVKYSFTVAICLVVSDGEYYFQEWIDYHLLAMKFDNIYVYDNSKNFDMERWYNKTRYHSIYNRVVIEHKPGPGYNKEKGKFLQSIIYEDCIQKYGKSKNGPQHDYFAFIDIDEFLVPQQSKYNSIHSILEEYLVPYGGALVSNWLLFGSANRTIYSPVPVTKRFQYRDKEPHSVVKTIVKTSDFRRTRNPHAVQVKHRKTIHTSEFPGAVQANVYNTSDKTKASSWVKASNVLLVHHYRYTSSKEYYYKRCIRDGLVGHWCDKKTKTIKGAENTPDHIQTRPGEVYDDKAWKLLTLHVPKYRIFDTPAWQDFM